MALSFWQTPATLPMRQTPITAWRLLVWAYRIQMVQYDVGWYEAAGFGEKDIPPTDFDLAMGRVKERDRQAHPDAVTVHRAVKALRMPTARSLLIETAARRAPPPWRLELAEHRVVPMRNGGGAIRRIWSKKGQPIGCLIAYEGVPKEEAERRQWEARERYRLWWDALRDVRSDLKRNWMLERFEVTHIGAPRDPWNR